MDIDKLNADRQRELSLLDSIAESYFSSACAGDVKSAHLLLEISHRRAELLGLDAPSRTQMEVISYDSEELQRQYAILSRIAINGGQNPMA